MKFSANFVSLEKKSAQSQRDNSYCNFTQLRNYYAMQFKRTHADNIEGSVVEDNPLFCTILVKLHQPGQSPTSILAVRAFTVDEAKNFADREVLANGHVCNGKCTNWKPV